MFGNLNPDQTTPAPTPTVLRTLHWVIGNIGYTAVAVTRQARSRARTAAIQQGLIEHTKPGYYHNAAYALTQKGRDALAADQTQLMYLNAKQTAPRETGTRGVPHTFRVDATTAALESIADGKMAIELAARDRDYVNAGDPAIVISVDGDTFIADVYDTSSVYAYLDLR